MVGVFTPRRTVTDQLQAGEVGFIVAGIKDIKGAPVGDTLIAANAADTDALPGFQKLSRRFMRVSSRLMLTTTKIFVMRSANSR